MRIAVAFAAAFDAVQHWANCKAGTPITAAVQGVAVYIKYRLWASGKFGNAECENKAEIADIGNRTPIIGHH